MTAKDLHNLRQRFSGDTSDEDKLLSVLENCLEKDDNSSVCVTVDEYNELQTLYIQTGRMKQVVANFPESLMLDCTYKVNNKKMVLATIIMATDGNGEGRVCAHALLKNEKQETLRVFLSKFKDLNPKTEQTKVFIVDKDFNEINLIRDIWPAVQFSYSCVFSMS